MLSSSTYLVCSDYRTEALHEEVKSKKNPILTRDTHPVVYAMVENLAAAAGINMPRYISVYDAEGMVVTRSGMIYKVTKDINAWVDVAGDLHICQEILTDLPYDVVEGIVAVAIAEKVSNKPAKLAAVGVGTFAATVAGVYGLNKMYDLKLGSLLSSIFYDRYSCYSAKQDALEGLFFLLILPALLAVNVAANNLQKSIDIKATEFIGTQQVIDGIKGRVKLKDMYSKENIFSRIANALQLKSIYNFLFYPVRAYTEDERVQYLSSLAL
jgi:hypothetical protein